MPTNFLWDNREKKNKEIKIQKRTQKWERKQLINKAFWLKNGEEKGQGGWAMKLNGRENGRKWERERAEKE